VEADNALCFALFAMVRAIVFVIGVEDFNKFGSLFIYLF